MGCYDSFMLKVKCPHCNEESVIEFQTKEFSCGLNTWSVGDVFTGMDIKEGIIRNVYGGCNSKKCRESEFKTLGYNSGFGIEVVCDVWIKDYMVKEALNIRKELKEFHKSIKR